MNKSSQHFPPTSKQDVNRFFQGYTHYKQCEEIQLLAKVLVSSASKTLNRLRTQIHLAVSELFFSLSLIALNQLYSHKHAVFPQWK